MKLTLNHFGVWHQKTFEFPDHGITLLTGVSGKGKTTLFRAINYALTGEGTKLPSHGEVKCGVTLEYLDMVITRTNRPARLIVVQKDPRTQKEMKYENDEAQGLIYAKIGRNFEIAGYVQQKGENSFLAKTPAEKLSFLERVAFANTPLDEIKEKARKLVHSSELALEGAQAEVKHLRTHPVTPVGTSPGNLEEVLAAHREATARKEDLTNRLKTCRVSRESELRLGEQYLRLDERIHDLLTLATLPDPLPPNHEEENLTAWDAYDSYLRELAQAKDLETKYILPHQAEMKKVETDLSSLTAPVGASLAEIETEMKELQGYLTEYRKQQDILQKRALYQPERYEYLVKEIPLLDDRYRMYLLGKDSRACPKCHTRLRFHADGLEVYGSDTVYSAATERELAKQLAELKAELQKQSVQKQIVEALPKIEEEIQLDPQEVEDRIAVLQKERIVHQSYNERKSALENKHRSLQSNTQIEQMRKTITQAMSRVEPRKPELSRNDLEKRLREITTRQDLVTSLQKSNSEKEQRRRSLEKERSALPLLGTVNVAELDRTIAELEKDIAGVEQLIQDTIHQKHACQTYEQQRIASEQYCCIVREKEQALKGLERKFTQAKKFREQLATAEMIALQSLIEEINTHLSAHINNFFPDNPLTIELRLFKENEKTKTVKNQVNIQVGYRGAVTDMTTLSGGEKDRINLAFTLALAEIFSIPLLMLDETLSSLDRESTENILEHIEKNRTVLIIAHQVSTGLFDHVYSL